MDETTLTDTLRSLAAEPVLHTAPSADARLRARQLRRRQVTRTAGVLAVVAIGGVAAATVHPHGATHVPTAAGSWVQQLKDPHDPMHATTGYVGVSRDAGGEWIVYWQDQRLCYQVIGTNTATGGQCSAPVQATSAPLTSVALGGLAGARFFVASPTVTTVDVTVLSVPMKTVSHGVQVTVDPGYDVTATPAGEDDFPHQVVIAEGNLVSLRARDKSGHQLGDAVPGQAAPQLAQVKVVAPCTGDSTSPLPAGTWRSPDNALCYQLEPAAMTFLPRTVHYRDDATQGWLIQVSLDGRDSATFAGLTRRLTPLPAPANQLAIVFDGKVVAAPTIQGSIANGQLQIAGGFGPAQLSKQQAQDLVAALGG